ncbi:MAG: glycine--tRNA ligase subunit beta, partial [Candidatus Atribacteria bacterium]|nr:glycine--tRNA ligase subunit beta [Candidatus Atribacteria bacterium]
MNKFILEIGIEEVPSLYIDKAIQDIKNMAISELKSLRISFGSIQTYGTPRRFIVYIEDIHSKQDDISQKIKGPSKLISFDEEGNLKNPAIKFAQMNQLNIDQLTIEKTDKGEYLFAKKCILGEKTESLLPGFCLKLITSLNFPKSMRWGSNSFRFIRPIRWLLALYNDQVIPFQLEKLPSGSISYGHRLLSPWPINIGSVDKYFELMKEHSIVIDPEERRKIIIEQMNSIIREHHGEQCSDQKLLDEVKNLVEYPSVLLGKFHNDYLK